MALSLVDKARGCLLGLMVGDALGAGVEGWPSSEIKAFAQARWKQDLVCEYFPAVHMGTYVRGKEPGTYQVALEANSGSNFVPTGPSANENTAKACHRYGTYTDDTNTSLALAASLVEKKALDGAHVARKYAEFWREGDHVRGYPPSAKEVMQSVLNGVSYTESGLPPHFPFRGGSFANGGAMRISALAIPFRSASAAQLRAACAEAVRSSHCHPEGVDGAVVQCSAVQWALNRQPSQGLDAHGLLKELLARAETEGMKERLGLLLKLYLVTRVDGEQKEGVDQDTKKDVDDVEELQTLIRASAFQRQGSGFGFQIAALDCMPCVFWIVCRYWREPAQALMRAIALGGDTDTVASMVGAVMGALHGVGWLPDNWTAPLENGSRGRDYALNLATELAGLNLA